VTPPAPAPVTAVGLFAGIGWAEVPGICETGIEYDSDVCATRIAAGHATVHADVTTLNPADYAGADGLIASPPCPPFGKSGRKLGLTDLPLVMDCIRDLAAGRDTRALYGARCLDERSILTAEPMRWLRALRPRTVLMEQVPSVLPVWGLYAEVLRGWGYSAATGVVDAAGYGLGSHRPRAVLLASRVREVALPAPTHGPGLLPYTSMADVTGWGYTRRPAPTVTSGGTYTGGAEPFGNGSRQAMRRAFGTDAWIPAPDNPARTRPTVAEAAALVGLRPGLVLHGNAGMQYRTAGNVVPPPLAAALAQAAFGLDTAAVPPALAPVPAAV
jgi:DNA (cytosine-5)-methyltransferase 1